MLLLKYYIHISRVKLTLPNVYVLRKRLIYNEKMERTIATDLSLLDKHVEKWDTVLDRLE